MGRINKNGTVVVRESKAIEDLMSKGETKSASIIFLPYNSDTGEIIFDY
ncbi:MAG: hypothetical protein IIT48_10865 [Lachnospiraceae bacterium]|nr:hypothetical protein [Lachnospiraceae bacterium]